MRFYARIFFYSVCAISVNQTKHAFFCNKAIKEKMYTFKANKDPFMINKTRPIGRNTISKWLKKLQNNAPSNIGRIVGIILGDNNH
mmetsp:Transcript_40514/g.47415  ORF Transcript_40514/g.47415 Transcript_40514/m.47415 type:complete len:86 (+) Transcript_40514:297-554(+)